MATLTVFTPAYNRAHTLPRTYESLQKQSCKDFVWLIVDDGSKDNSGCLCDEFTQQDSKIHVIHKQNAGQGLARNDGLNIAKGH